MPNRIQRRRTAGWRMPEGAIYVGRPGVFGNPFPVYIYGQAKAIDLFRRWLSGNMSGTELGGLSRYPTISLVSHRSILRAGLPKLRGHDLACWCRLCPDHRDGLPLGLVCAACAPCHADVLLGVANA